MLLSLFTEKKLSIEVAGMIKELLFALIAIVGVIIGQKDEK
jgi:hypothetical protein